MRAQTLCSSSEQQFKAYKINDLEMIKKNKKKISFNFYLTWQS